TVQRRPHSKSPVPSSSGAASPEIPTNQITSDKHNLPLFLALIFDLRAHMESLGHGVSGCPGLRMTSRRCAGFLTKQGGRVKTWKRRWFLL
ncbi:hypothetical protein NHX12_009715, partial [Muraenolepis orangiensis]